MLSLLKRPAEKDKILSGLPAETETAGAEGSQENLIENHMAVVLNSAHPYVISILSNNIKNLQKPKKISKKFLQTYTSI